jgi:hypothetical protein
VRILFAESDRGEKPLAQVYVECLESKNRLSNALKNFDAQYCLPLNQKINQARERKSSIISDSKREEEVLVVKRKEEHVLEGLKPLQLKLSSLGSEIEKVTREKESVAQGIDRDKIRQNIQKDSGRLSDIATAVGEVKVVYEKYINDSVKSSCEHFIQSTLLDMKIDLTVLKSKLDKVYGYLESYTTSKLTKMDDAIYKLLLMNRDASSKGSVVLITGYIIILFLVMKNYPTFTLPVMLGVLSVISLSTFVQTSRIRRGYTEILAMEYAVTRYYSDVDSMVEAEYTLEIQKHLDDCDTRLASLNNTLQHHYNLLTKKRVELINNFDEAGIRAKVQRELKEYLATVDTEIISLNQKLTEMEGKKITMQDDLNSVRTALSESRESLEQLMKPREEGNKISNDILPNYVFVGLDDATDYPVLLEHNKYCTVVFYDDSTARELVVGLISACYLNITNSMKDGSSYINLLDTERDGNDFKALEKNKDSFNDDLGKRQKYLFASSNRLEEFNSFVLKDINERLANLAHSNFNNVDDYNNWRRSEGNSTVPYRIPIFFGFGKDALTSADTKKIISLTCKYPNKKCGTVNLRVSGSIPIIFLPYQYFTKNDNFDALIDLLDIIGTDNMYEATSNDLVKLKEENIKRKISDLKREYESYKNSLANSNGNGSRLR